ncbi:MAG: hypothetical protein R8P61_32295 [Bacteroidia bacterium]|nr:hypothetical protein [Bacteroidia bacterium]
MLKLAFFSKKWLLYLLAASRMMLLPSCLLLHGGSLQASTLASTGPRAAINLKVIIAGFLFLWWIWNWGVKGKGTLSMKDGDPVMSSQVEAFPTVMEMEVHASNLYQAKRQFFEKSGAIEIDNRGSKKVILTYVNGEKELYQIRYRSGGYYFTEIA